MSTHPIPDIVVGRLPIYLRALRHLAENGKATTSSHELGRQLGISSAQIRKDLSHFGEFGKQGTGYNVNYLIGQLRHILNLEAEWCVALVGVGFLGQALANYPGFTDRGFRICRVFDKDLERVGKKVNGIAVQHISELTETVRREHIQVAILALPAWAAQDMADVLVKAGIKAILTYAPINLIVPPDVYVRYSDPVVQLQQMAYYLNREAADSAG